MDNLVRTETFTGNNCVYDGDAFTVDAAQYMTSDVVIAAPVDGKGREGDVHIEGRHVFIDGEFILTLAEGVKFDVLQEIFALKNDVKQSRKERASLAVHQTRLAQKVNELERRLINSERREKILKARVNILERPGIEKKSIGETLRQARDDANERHLSKAEQELDEYTFKVFDLESRLEIAGGHYVLQNVIDDILLIHPEKSEMDFEVDLDDVVASALRWCKRHTCYWRNKRFWVERVGGYLIIKRNRFVFQAKENPPQAIDV